MKKSKEKGKEKGKSEIREKYKVKGEVVKGQGTMGKGESRKRKIVNYNL